jgi:two-component system cell cycle response regulator DivK
MEADPVTTDRQRSFLYVEDDSSSRHLIKILMATVLGYTQLTIFEDSSDFLDRVRALPAVPDVIFMDIHVAPLDGYALLEMLRSEPGYKDVPVVAMTAGVMAADVSKLKRAGFNGLIGKPIRKKVFPEQLDKIMAGEPIWEVR